MNKPRPIRKLAELTSEFLADAFKKQGFAATEMVTRWKDIAGPEIAAHAEPIKLQWPRERQRRAGRARHPGAARRGTGGDRDPAPVRGDPGAGQPFFGWQAVGRIALRQAPLARPKAKAAPPKLDPAEVARVEATLTAVTDEELRAALGRLGAAVKGR